MGMRVFLWADAPAELREAIEAGGAGEWGYLAWIAPTNQGKAEGAFGWTEVRQVQLEDGSLVIAGNRRRRP